MIFITVIISLLFVFNIVILQVIDRSKDNYSMFPKIVLIVLVNILLSFIGTILSVYCLSLV